MLSRGNVAGASQLLPVCFISSTSTRLLLTFAVSLLEFPLVLHVTSEKIALICVRVPVRVHEHVCAYDGCVWV